MQGVNRGALHSVGDKIREARTASGISQEKLAQSIGVTRMQVFNWEKSRNEPHFANLKKIAECTKNPVSYFTGNPSDDADAVPGATEQPVMRQGSYADRNQDRARAKNAIAAAVQRVQAAQAELSQALAALGAAQMMMEG